MSKLIMLSGIPGSGKSFLSNLLKKMRRSHVYIISSDALRSLALGDQQDLSEDKMIFEMMYKLPEVYALDKEGIVLLDATHPKEQKRADLIKDLSPLFDEVDLIMFQLDRTLVETQNVEREFPVPQFVIDKFYTFFEGVGEIDKKTFDRIFVIKDKTQIMSLIDEI